MVRSRLYIFSLAAANLLTGGGIKSCSSVAAGPSLGASLQSLHLLLIDFLIPYSSCCKPFPLSSIPLISLFSTHRVAGDRASVISSLSHCLLVLCHLHLTPRIPFTSQSLALSFTPCLLASVFPGHINKLKSSSTYKKANHISCEVNRVLFSLRAGS